MIEAGLFLGAAVAGLTELFRFVRDKNWTSVATIVAAVVFGVLLAVVDTEVGVSDITIAQGVLLGLAAAGVVGTAKRVG